MSANKDTWVEWGERDPYFAVVTIDKFHRDNLDADAKQAFFETGRQHVEDIWADLVDVAGGEFRPEAALDYGCGVGRILLPLAERCERVIGVDISQPMLDEVRKNATGYPNIECRSVDEFLSDASARYDLVHTFIVLQHIPPRQGYGVIGQLASGLAGGGVGMIHVTFKAKGPMLARLRSRMYRDVPSLHRFARKLFRLNMPFMPVYEYELDRVRGILIANGCTIVKEKDTDHGFLGKMFFISKGARG